MHLFQFTRQTEKHKREGEQEILISDVDLRGVFPFFAMLFLTLQTGNWKLKTETNLIVVFAAARWPIKMSSSNSSSHCRYTLHKMGPLCTFAKLYICEQTCVGLYQPYSKFYRK